ncbi:MAG: PAS domain-containing sensor histidine kinase [Ignavibacteriaceae bacterium]
MNNVVDILGTLTPGELDKKLFQFIEYFPAAAFLLDENLVIKNANKLAESIIGFNSEKIFGKNIIEFFPDKDTDQFRKILQKSFASPIPNTAEMMIRTADGNNLNVLSMFRCFKDFDTNNEFCVLAIIDFTPQKMKEEIIRDSEERFKNMANTAPVMIWIADVEGLFSFVNKVWLDYSGGELGNQLGINWLNNVHPDDLEKVVNNYQKALRTKRPFSIEFRFMDKKSKYEWMLIKGKPRYSDENMYLGFIGSCISIHDQKEFEAKISNLNEELVHTIATKDKFFSIISHDLRSPLSGLMGILDILSTDYESLEEKEKREFIKDASVASKTTFTLMENLLEWSRIQTGKINYQPERLKIQRLVESIASLYGQNLKNKEIEFITNISPDIFAFADKSMTETIFRNLISNAIKFTHTGGKITVSSEIENNMAIIKVNDSGVGIEEENIPKLFRVDAGFSTKGTKDESGTGLGLIICKELVEKQEGKIWVKSKKNEGSTFYYSVPIAK